MLALRSWNLDLISEDTLGMTDEDWEDRNGGHCYLPANGIGTSQLMELVLKLRRVVVGFESHRILKHVQLQHDV